MVNVLLKYRDEILQDLFMDTVIDRFHHLTRIVDILQHTTSALEYEFYGFETWCDCIDGLIMEGYTDCEVCLILNSSIMSHVINICSTPGFVQLKKFMVANQKKVDRILGRENLI